MLISALVASDQYGNYLIQYILTHANPNHRDIVASHIRYDLILKFSQHGVTLTFTVNTWSPFVVQNLDLV